MKKLFTFAAGLMTGATMLLAAAPALARTNVVVQIPAPVTYVAPRTVQVQPVPLYSVRHHLPYRGQPVHHGLRDRDRDGVPNRFDRRPHNPYRY